MHFVVGVITENESANEVFDLMEPFDFNFEEERVLESTRAEFLSQKREYYKDFMEDDIYKNCFLKFKAIPEHLLDIFKDVEEVSDYSDKDFASHLKTIGVKVTDIAQERKRYKEYCNSEEYQDYLKVMQISKYYLRIFEGIENALTLNDDDFFAYVVQAEGIKDDSFDEAGNYYVYINTRGLYDWYVIGGRWENRLRLMDGSNATYSKVENIDFKQSPEDCKRRGEYWDYIVDGILLDDSTEKPTMFGSNKERLLSVYKTREGYCNSESAAFTGHFITPSGELYHDGHWSGGGEESTESYHAQFKQMLQDYQDHYFWLVDCHC